MNNKLSGIYEKLLAHYGDLNWWPAQSTYEVMVGAILTQNTAWGNVEKAMANFGADLSPQRVAAAKLEDLKEIIRPAGFFNQKAVYLKELTAWFAKYGYDKNRIKKEPLDDLRTELLAVKGVGPETADSILLYAFGFPTFVVDAYTIRLCGRYPMDAGKGYGAVKAYFEGGLPRNEKVYNNFHALMVINGKDHCKKKKPSCGDCPLEEGCEKLGL